MNWHPVRDHRNPGGFDFAAYCFDRHIALIGSAGGVHVTAYHADWLQRFRQRLRGMLRSLPESQAGVLEALLLGDRHDVPLAVSDAFAATGTAHLLAISGLHIGMAALWGGLLCWWLLTRREAWIVAIPVRGVSAAFGLLVAIAYASAAGWPLPTERAALMLAGGVLAWWLRERTSSVNVLLAALMLIVLWDAGAVASASLWLSFAATLAILLWGGAVRVAGGGRLRRWLLPLVWITLLATLATLPLVVQIFGRLPLYSLPANILLVPLYSLFVLPLSLLSELLVLFGATHVAALLAAWAGYGVEAGNMLLARMHAWPGGNLWVPAVPWAASFVYGAGMLLSAWLFHRRQPRRAAGCMAATMALYLVWVVPERAPAVPEFVAWDVGQGAASSLMLPGGQVMVVDVPGRWNSRFNGGTTVAAGLRALGSVHADVLVLSHAQADHMGGAKRLLDQLHGIGELWLADVPLNHRDRRMREIVRRVQASGGHVRWLARGEHMDMGHAHVDILWPPRGFAPTNPNNGCLVLAVRLVNGARLLLPGDIEAPAEAGVLASHPKHDGLLLMPHHGSRTSSTPAWVDAISPRVAIAQTGYHNRYHFPTRPVVRRYRRHGAEIWNTANGAVIAAWPAGTLHVRQCDRGMEAKRNRALQWVKSFHG